ncbi:MAG: proline dehydrogenase family protein [Planctomycetota bacterium]
MIEKLVLASLPYVPGVLMRRLSARYIAGETLEEAIAVLGSLSERGHPGILDVLGEHVADEKAAREAARAYTQAADAVAQARLDAYISVKPTHFGLLLDEGLCFELYAGLAEHCGQRGLFVRVEMEDHPTTDATLRVFARLRALHGNVGIVLQSRLFRTPADIDSLPAGPVDVRLVKGIYLEPSSIAHVDPEPIRVAYVDCARRLFARGARVALATHDDAIAERCLAVAREMRIESGRYEFQVLLGVREELWAKWKAAGLRVRVYVPYGPEWRAYSQRRLRKNPQVLRHVMRNAFGLR